MRVLADTNILLRLLNPTDPQYPMVREAVDALFAGGEQLCFVPQNLVEFWNVCTRPSANNGFGLTSAETDARAKLIEGRLLFLPETERVHTEWRRLVVEHSVAGAQVHDARIAPRVLTLNDRDFARYPGILAVHPRDVLRATNR